MKAPPTTEAPRTEGPEPVTGVVGVEAAATSQIQFVLSVQLGLRHDPEIHTSPELQSELSEQPLLHEERTGVGVGVAVAETQVQLD
jgi:hypothetical protein